MISADLQHKIDELVFHDPVVNASFNAHRHENLSDADRLAHVVLNLAEAKAALQAELRAALAATAPTVAVDSLLPCPFCGESCIEGPRPEYIERAAGYGYTVYNVGHAQLSSSRKKCIAWVTAESQSDVIERWNARAKLSAGVDQAHNQPSSQFANNEDAKSSAPSGVAIPEGWALVPVEPTEEMISDGFESVPDEIFSPYEVWQEYEALSGCQQAAYRARACYKAMLSAAPSPDQQGE